MGVLLYNPESYRIVHYSSVDFSYRIIDRPIHIVQYDKEIPIIAVSLYLNGRPYVLNQDMEVKIRWSKPDRTFIYKNILGCNQPRNIVYFEVDEQMSFYPGKCEPIIELFIVTEGVAKKAGSSPIYIEIDRNPIQTTDLESISEYSDIELVIIEAKEAIANLNVFKGIQIVDEYPDDPEIDTVFKIIP
jgi:hypothetical protein